MRFTLFALLSLCCAVSSASSISVSSPVSGVVTSPFQVFATSQVCGSQPTAAMGYSLDNSAQTTIVNGHAISGVMISGLGWHVVHVKCWGPNNAADVANVDVDVTEQIPSNAIAASNVQDLTDWVARYDPATAAGGSASGTMAIVSSPSMSGRARQFNFAFNYYGGELFYSKIGTDTSSTHFVYDGYVMLPNPADIANVEMDFNQVMPNGQTVIFGFQCDGWNGVWDYTANTGASPQQYKDSWLHSSVACPKPSTWSSAWHHVQIAYSRDAVGNVTYESVVFDGEYGEINKTVPSAFALGWGPSLITNFQLDGNQSGSGSATAYLDNLTIYRW